MNARRVWLCVPCDRSRRSAFCPDCGQAQPEPDESGDGEQMEGLQMLAKFYRKEVGSAYNTARTLQKKGFWLDPCGYERDGEREAEGWWKRHETMQRNLRALEWALERLSP